MSFRAILCRFVGGLRRDRSGASAVEFALAAPILMLIIAATMQMAQAYYVRTILQGAVNRASRNSTLQSAQTSQADIDKNVSHMIHDVMPSATTTFVRKNYADFTAVGTPEDFTDSNNNGVHDATECFNDLNGNSTWDDDVGKTGLGGAGDVVVYTVSVSYDQWFGFAHAMGLPLTQTIHATTILRNQPFATQTTRTGVQVCPT